MNTDKPPDATARKVMLVDDHPVVREALAMRIDREPDLTVCATIGTCGEVFPAIEAHHPDLVILDLAIPDGHGLDVAKELHTQYPEIAVLIFSMYDESLYCERALRAGARGYIMKHESPERVIAAIRQVLEGEILVSPSLAKRILASAISGKGASIPSIERLSDRELEIFHMIGTGLETKEIAARLHRGIKTIETHRMRLKEKLGIHSNCELIAKAAAWVASASTNSKAKSE